jgi:hypothetical protein
VRTTTKPICPLVSQTLASAVDGTGNFGRVVKHFGRTLKPIWSQSLLPRDMKESRLPAREPKFSAPFFQILIKVEVCFQDHCYCGHLWDVSRAGACIRSFQQFPMGAAGQIRFYDPSDSEVIEAKGELIWMNQLRGAHYYGLRFEDDFDISKTFLRLLVKTEEP